MQYDQGRLFDVMRGARIARRRGRRHLEGLKAGKVTDEVRAKFAAAGSQLPAEAAVKVDEEGKEADPCRPTIGGQPRDYKSTMQGPRFSAFKVISTADKDEADVPSWSTT